VSQVFIQLGFVAEDLLIPQPYVLQIVKMEFLLETKLVMMGFLISTLGDATLIVHQTFKVGTAKAIQQLLQQQYV